MKAVGRVTTLEGMEQAIESMKVTCVDLRENVIYEVLKDDTRVPRYCVLPEVMNDYVRLEELKGEYERERYLKTIEARKKAA